MPDGGSRRALRCAIYTRKSTEEGLEQDFNSLDAQREACAAYILSQRHEGWTLVPDHYDDGGYSGGNMDRPALKLLMAELAAGRVDIIVVYKVDRLTRSLADFAKIVDVLDKSNASFVSVTAASASPALVTAPAATLAGVTAFKWSLMAVTAWSFNCAVPTVFGASAVAAYAVPPIENTKATVAATSA